MGRPVSAVGEDLVGRVVYPFGRPQRLGRIVRGSPYAKMVLVWWMRSDEPQLEDIVGLMDYEALVLETEQKARNHRQKYEKALTEKY